MRPGKLEELLDVHRVLGDEELKLESWDLQLRGFFYQPTERHVGVSSVLPTLPLHFHSHVASHWGCEGRLAGWGRCV